MKDIFIKYTFEELKAATIKAGVSSLIVNAMPDKDTIINSLEGKDGAFKTKVINILEQPQEKVSFSPKINSVILTGNLVKDAIVSSKALIIRMALWNGKDKKGNDREATFVDVMLVNFKDVSKLTKGKRVSIKGRLANYKDKESKWAKTGVIGYAIDFIEYKKVNKVDQVTEKPKEDNLKDIPWEIDL